MHPPICTSLRSSSPLLLLAFAPFLHARATGGLSLAASAATVARVAPGATLVVPVMLDMSAATAGANVASMSTALSWGVSRLTFDSVQAGPFGALTANTAGAAGGTVLLSATNPLGATASVTVATLFFTATPGNGSTQIVLAPGSAANVSGASVPGGLAPRNLDVGVAPVGVWGDANGSDAVNIVDAQQLARFSVGLSVANPAALAARGDVTADLAVNIVDAQQVARFSVGLTAAARVNTPLYVAPVVASVAIAPLSPTVATGAGTQLTATPRDASSAVVTGFTTVTWASSNTNVATVNASGFVAGVAAGTAVITASADGRSAQVTLSVSPPLNGPVVAECAAPQPAWIWCDDFEADRLASYFEYSSGSGRFVRAAGVGVSASTGMSARYPTAPASGPGQLHLAFGIVPDPYFRPVDAGTQKYREVYWRHYIMHPVGWLGGGPDKLSRAISFATSGWAEAMIAHVWDGQAPDNRLFLDPASGTDVAGTLKTTGYNDFANLRWLGSAPSSTNIFSAANLGVWQCVEAHVRLNDAGQSNGVFDLWINGTLEANRSGLNWVGAYSAFGINAVFFENYWNDGAPVEQTRYWDNIVVSTERIGC